MTSFKQILCKSCKYCTIEDRVNLANITLWSWHYIKAKEISNPLQSLVGVVQSSVAGLCFINEVKCVGQGFPQRRLSAWVIHHKEAKTILVTPRLLPLTPPPTMHFIEKLVMLSSSRWLQVTITRPSRHATLYLKRLKLRLVCRVQEVPPASNYMSF